MKSIFFILSSLFFITSCSNSNPEKAQGNLVTNPVSASDPNADIAGEAPIMTFVENIHNFGTLVDGEVVTHKFKFTNTGKTALIISSASVPVAAVLCLVTQKHLFNRVKRVLLMLNLIVVER